MSIAEPALRRWTVEEYRRAADAGVFGPEERLELIEGEILRMSPQNPPHMVATRLTLSALETVFRDGWVVFVQMPLALDAETQPEPDLWVARGTARDYLADRPATAELVVEVSDTTLAFDRDRKAPLYVRAGIPEYWILNLTERCLEVHRQPNPASGQYEATTRVSEDGAISPLAAPAAAIAVRDMLP